MFDYLSEEEREVEMLLYVNILIGLELRINNQKNRKDLRYTLFLQE